MNKPLELCARCRDEIADRNRTEAQNALLWHWNREISDQTGNSPEWVHGESKMTILVPMKKGFGGKGREEVEEFEQIAAMVTDYDLIIRLADRYIRTKPPSLTVKRFGEYLKAYEQFYLEKGFHLTQTADYRLAVGSQ